MIPEWKKEKPELKSFHSHVLKEVVKSVDLAFQAFFRRVKNGKTPGDLNSKAIEGMIVSLTLNLVLS
jgi:hypothetical protein